MPILQKVIQTEDLFNSSCASDSWRWVAFFCVQQLISSSHSISYFINRSAEGTPRGNDIRQGSYRLDYSGTSSSQLPQVSNNFMQQTSTVLSTPQSAQQTTTTTGQLGLLLPVLAAELHPSTATKSPISKFFSQTISLSPQNLSFAAISLVRSDASSSDNDVNEKSMNNGGYLRKIILQGPNQIIAYCLNWVQKILDKFKEMYLSSKSKGDS